jgi:hypothetical protein
MGRKVNVVVVPSTEVTVEGYSVKQYTVEAGNKRTLFLVFKSDDIPVKEFDRIKRHLDAVMAPDDNTKIVMFALALGDDFEIHELEG